MVNTSVDKDPADSNVIILRPFTSFVGFTASLDTAIQIMIEKIAIAAITPADI